MNNGRPYTFQSTKECHKYAKYGMVVAAATKKPHKKKPYKKHGVGDDQQMAYLTDTIKLLVKRRLKKAAKKRHKKHSLDDSSSNSNSE